MATELPSGTGVSFSIGDTEDGFTEDWLRMRRRSQKRLRTGGDFSDPGADRAIRAAAFSVIPRHEIEVGPDGSLVRHEVIDPNQ